MVAWSSVVMLCAVEVEAQVTRPPARVFQQQREPGRESDRLQNLTLEMDLLGGFDDNLDLRVGQPFLPSLGGYSGYAATRLRYEFGRQERSLAVQGGGFASGYRTGGVTSKPSYGGDLSLEGRTQVGRNTQLSASQNVRSDPFFTLGAFNPLQPVVGGTGTLGSAGIDSGPITAVTEVRSLMLETTASMAQQLTPRTTMGINYHFSDRSYEESVAFDSRIHVVALSYDQSVGRSSGLRASYRYSDFDSVDFTGLRVPIKDQTADVGFRYGRNLSRTRRVELSAGGGSVYVDTIDTATLQPRRFWGPSAYGTAAIDLGRSWTLDMRYGTRVSVLQGVSAQAFLTDSASVGVGGLLKDRVQLVLLGAYSNGSTGGVNQANEVGKFDSYELSSQVSFLVTAWWSAMASFTLYRYELNDVASQDLLLPPILDRSSVFVGFTLRAPLIGGPLR